MLDLFVKKCPEDDLVDDPAEPKNIGVNILVKIFSMVFSAKQ